MTMNTISRPIPAIALGVSGALASALTLCWLYGASPAALADAAGGSEQRGSESLADAAGGSEQRGGESLADAAGGSEQRSSENLADATGGAEQRRNEMAGNGSLVPEPGLGQPA